MIKKLLLTLSMAGLFGAAQAQTVPCGTDYMHQLRKSEHPQIADNEVEIKRQILENIAKIDISKYAKTTEDGATVEYHVPIVFHIIHNFQNSIWSYTSDAQLVEAVAQINRMYNKMNADTADVIAPYKGLIKNSTTPYIGNAHITFHLATKDPFGNPTTGVTRRHHYLSDYGSDYAKFDLWPPASYINIWVVNVFKPSTDGTSPAAYAYKPTAGAEIPFWDGVIALPNYVNYGNALPHELGHSLDLDHTFGGTNGDTSSKVPDPWFVNACGDDDVDDTPPTKGHKPKNGISGSACNPLALYDTTCLVDTITSVAKIRLDSNRRRRLTPVSAIDTTTVLIFSDTSTTKGITFESRTASKLQDITIYPADTIGSTYAIGVFRVSDNALVASKTFTSTVTGQKLQRVNLGFNLAPLPKDQYYKLRFITNPGAYRDTVVPTATPFLRGLLGSVYINESNSDSMYNFFYNWTFVKSNYRIYGADSLVDYPDTVNAQNVMDYTYCSKMFTNGQTVRMRAALTSSVAHRDSLITEANQKRTGIHPTDTIPKMKPEALYAVQQAAVVGATAAPAYFLCADGARFVFRNYTWQAAATSTNWILSNDAEVPTSTSTTTVSSKFSKSGWATVMMIATNAVGSDTFVTNPGVYVADPNTINPIGYYQDFNPGTDLDKWPIFNYFNNRYKWEVVNNAGYYDGTSMRYRSFDDRTSYPANATGDPTGDYDDFFTPAFDLSGLGVNGNLNFMMSGSYNTTNSALMNDALEITYSSNCGVTWNSLTAITGTKLQTRGLGSALGTEYTPTSGDDWIPVNIDLKSGTTPIRDAKVFFRFRYKPSARSVPGGGIIASGNNIYIDRINIGNFPLGVNEMVLGNRNVAVSPNPTNSSAFVLFRKPNAHVNIQVMDITGKVVYSIDRSVTENNSHVEIPASVLTVKGMYLVRISGDDNLNQTEKLIAY